MLSKVLSFILFILSSPPDVCGVAIAYLVFTKATNKTFLLLPYTSSGNLPSITIDNPILR